MPSPPPLPAGPIPETAEKIQSTQNPQKTKQGRKSKAKKNEKVIQKNVDCDDVGQKSKLEYNSNKSDTKSHDSDNDGWEHFFDEKTQRYFFYNNRTKVRQWKNPRVPDNDPYNQDLPTTEPPLFPFEEDTPYDRALRELKKDEEFIKLSTYEKYLRVEELKKKLDQQEETKETHVELIGTEQKTKEVASKVTKRQIKQFNERKKRQKEKKLMNWLTKD